MGVVILPQWILPHVSSPASFPILEDFLLVGMHARYDGVPCKPQMHLFAIGRVPTEIQGTG